MATLTIEIDPTAWHWLDNTAHGAGISVEVLIAEILSEYMDQTPGPCDPTAYDAAMTSFLSMPPEPISDGSGYPRRETLYDRGRW